MPTTRAILTQLSRDELLGVLDAYDLRVSDRRVKDQLVDALLGGDDSVVTRHHDHRPELQPFGQVHRADGDVTA